MHLIFRVIHNYLEARKTSIVSYFCIQGMIIEHKAAINLLINNLNLFIMIGWIIAALIGAFIFALLGFTGIAKGFAAIAKILFYIFLVIFVVVLIMNFAS
jgi:uncharacterized membrane protein YtjA (UPF0391 family)